MNFTFSSTLISKTSSQLINYQIVRWRKPRKPFWLGMAKTKMFIVPEPKRVATPEEKVQNSKLNQNYRTQIDSLLNFIRCTNPKLDDVFSQENANEESINSISKIEAAILKSFDNNSIWNAESARRREQRMRDEKQKYMEKALETIEAYEENKKKEMELIEDIVKKEKLLSATYVTPENIDKAIENSLNNVQNYDFAIDLQGNKYPGSEPLRLHSSDQKVETSVSA